MGILHDANLPEGAGTKLPEGAGQHPPQSFVDDFLKLRQHVAMEQLVRDTVPGAQGGKKDETQPIAAMIVQKAMEMSEKAADRYEKMAEHNDGAAQQARKEAEHAKENMYGIMFSEMSNAIKGLKDMREDIIRGNQPKTLDEQLKQVAALEEVLHSRDGSHQSPPAPQLDPNVTITLEKMREDHELAMKRLEVEIAKMNREYSLKVDEWRAENDRKRQEYEDGKGFKKDALSVISDLAAAAGAGFNERYSEGGVGAKVKESPGQAKPESAPDGLVKSFPCKFCHTLIAVPEEGGDVTCPNEECGASYAMRK